MMPSTSSRSPRSRCSPRATRPSTAGRAGCRSPPSPRAAPTSSAARSTTSNAIRTGTPTAGPTSSTAIRRRRAAGTRLGLLDRRPDRKAGRQQQAVLLLRQEFQPRTTGNNVHRFRVPTALERQGDFSQTTDNNGTLFPYIKDPLPHRHLLGRRARRPASRTAAWSAGFRRTGSTRPA